MAMTLFLLVKTWSFQKPDITVTVPSMDNYIDVVITADANAHTYDVPDGPIEDARVDFREVA